jgi:hypothetical protein
MMITILNKFKKDNKTRLPWEKPLDSMCTPFTVPRKRSQGG